MHLLSFRSGLAVLEGYFAALAQQNLASERFPLPANWSGAPGDNWPPVPFAGPRTWESGRPQQTLRLRSPGPGSSGTPSLTALGLSLRRRVQPQHPSLIFSAGDLSASTQKPKPGTQTRTCTLEARPAAKDVSGDVGAEKCCSSASATTAFADTQTHEYFVDVPRRGPKRHRQFPLVPPNYPLFASEPVKAATGDQGARAGGGLALLGKRQELAPARPPAERRHARPREGP